MAPRVTPASLAICFKVVRETPCSTNNFSAASKMLSRVAAASSLVLRAISHFSFFYRFETLNIHS
jgi:hypothetical protein